MSLAPIQDVLVWMGDRSRRRLFATAITEVEVRTGIANLPVDARRQGLADAAERMLGKMFAGRVLPFDGSAARAYAEIASASHRAGHPISQSDCQIAAVARSKGMAVATRNVRDFSVAGVELIDPWANVCGSRQSVSTDARQDDAGRVHRQVTGVGVKGTLGRAVTLHRPLPPARRADADRRRSGRWLVLLQARCAEGHWRRRPGRCREARLLRVGVQGQACEPRREGNSGP